MEKVIIWRCLGCGKTQEGGATIPAKCPHCGDDETTQAEFEMVEKKAKEAKADKPKDQKTAKAKEK